MKIDAVYNKIAEEYHKKTADNFYNTSLERPTVKKMFRGIDFTNKNILDLGCGSGNYSKWALKRGAKVWGLDPSKKFIEIAKQTIPKGKFILGSACKLPFSAAKFHFIISGLALDHEKNLQRTFQEIYRVLKKNGLFVFSRTNAITEITSKTEEGCFTFDRYFTEGKRMLSLPSYGVKVPYYHFRLDTIIKLLIKTGFAIEDYTDARPAKSTKKKYPREYKLSTDRPLFSVFRVRK